MRSRSIEWCSSGVLGKKRPLGYNSHKHAGWSLGSRPGIEISLVQRLGRHAKAWRSAAIVGENETDWHAEWFHDELQNTVGVSIYAHALPLGTNGENLPLSMDIFHPFCVTRCRWRMDCCYGFCLFPDLWVYRPGIGSNETDVSIRYVLPKQKYC